jgi:hypothetical protein
LTFDANKTNGIAAGMTLSPISNLVGPGTTVTAVDSTKNTVTVSPKLQGPLPSGGQAITFNFPLSSGIAQHVDPIFAGFGFFGNVQIGFTPAGVATAVIPLNAEPPLPDYLDITISATRYSQIIPISDTFYNVKVSRDQPPDTPDQYQAIPVSDTSLYISLPPQPGTTPISLEVPQDGSAPRFDQLYQAMQTALANNPIPGLTISSLITSPAQCARIAYDIEWSTQNTLPAPPDALESLYTNPPNPGGGGGNATGTASGSNNFEQDRQKFEGTLNSFYSTRDANAERLAKFVAAASAAVACEQASVNSAAGLLEFPVDPSAAFATAVESELLVEGLGTTGSSGLNFGVPAAFFYALHAHLDKSTKAAQRFQMACGEAIERLLQQFASAVDTGVINAVESFADTSVIPAQITTFQAARRLVALGVSAASASPAVTVFAGSPLASLINTWLSVTEPLAQNPPLSYQNSDFNIWTQQLAITNPDGYVELDLDALTHGYIIPPFAAAPSASAASGSADLTFGLGTGIGVGMPVFGTNIAEGTIVQSIVQGATATTVTLSAPVQGSVSTTDLLVFNCAIAPLTSTTAADCAQGTAILTLEAGGANGVSDEMLVFGVNIAPGTTVQSITQSPTAPTVTLNGAVAADLPSGSVVTFVNVPTSPIAPSTATTTVDCPPGITLTFGPGTISGVSDGMTVIGAGIAPGTTVQIDPPSATAATVTLSAGVAADVSSGSTITFAPIAATTSADCPQGSSTLTFASGATAGITDGMAVIGGNIAAGTTVQSVTDATVTLSGAGVAGDVPSGSIIAFAPVPAVTAKTTADCLAGNTLTFGPGCTNGINAGMPVFGAGIAAGTAVQSVTATTVTLSNGVPGDVPSGSIITFAPVTARTTADCPSGTTGLTFASTTGVSAGMPVVGVNIAPGTTVNSVTATTVTLSGSGVAGDVPSGSVIVFAVVPSMLADQIAAWLPSTTSPSTPHPTVATLKQVTAVQWTTFFTVTGNPQWLPPLTQPASPGAAAGQVTPKPGYIAARIRAFVRKVEQFFTVSTATTTAAQLPPAGAPSTFDLPAYDPIGQAAAGITFGPGDTLSGADLAAEAHNIFPGDPAAQAWLVEAMTTINELWLIATAVPNPTMSAPFVLPYPVSLQFSIMEALYARGFRRAVEILDLSQPDFQQALTGTVAYDHYAALYTAAQSLAQATPANGQPSAGFEPINPDGSLVDCVPPPCLSPTGPIAYLREILTVSELSRCDDATRASVTLTTTAATDNGSGVLPFDNGTDGVSAGMSVAMSAGTDAQIPTGTTVTAVTDTSVTVNPPVQVGSGESVVFSAPTLGTVLSQRRGPVGDLAANCANLQTPLPLIDLVNECLEYLGSPTAPAAGTVYDTATDSLAGHTLAAPGDDSGQVGDAPEGCHDPVRVLAALPQHSTPGLPDNPTPQPPVYEQLKADFSSCVLPYSQALDVSRTYLAELRSSRFEEMRAFRRCITEFVLAPTQEPAGFQSWRWRYPVRIDTAIEYLHITPEEYTTLFGGTPAAPCAAIAAPEGGNGGAAPQPPASPQLDPQPSGAAPQAPTTQEAPTQAAAQEPATPVAAQEPAIPVAAVEPVTQVAAQASAVQVVQSNAPQAQQPTASRGALGLPAFLADTCLSYCEFFELWESGYVTFSNGAASPTDGPAREGDGGQSSGAFPSCEPCCPQNLWLQFPEGHQDQGLAQLQVFVRLWRKLREHCGGYSFAQLRDICDVLQMWSANQRNSDFIRQLAALQMLRDDFGMDLINPAAPPAPGAVDADRTHLLALWVGPSAAQWPWALRQLIARVEQHAARRHGCAPRPVEFVKLLVDNLDPLSRLAGFDPDSAQYCWHFLPTHTLRFAELLAKIYASDFTVGELLFLFTADPHLDGDDPFPLQALNDALDFPLGLPDDEHEHSLWRLRRELLEALGPEAESHDLGEAEGDGEQWSWPRIEAALNTEFGFAPSDIAQLGQHFFPRLVARLGAQPATPSAAWFVSNLDANDTSVPMWNDPPDGPLHYDPTPSPGQLSTRVPLSDRAVITKLTGVRELQGPERKAVQDLFFQPRALLARFALLFGDLAAAQRALIEDPDEQRRFAYFRRQFLRCRHRTHLIANHLACHVTAVTGQQAPDEGAAALILRTLAADENKAQGGWENDSGTPPALTWAQPAGSALAALLGLSGTGLRVEYRSPGGAVVWRDMSGGLRGFGDERNRENCPVPTVLPGMDATLTPQQLQFAGVHNGLLMDDTTGEWLGGAQGFTATWSGALLIDRAGTYEFWAGAPTPGEDRPEPSGANEGHRWRVVLRRGQRTWVILSHHCDGEEERPAAALPLKLGAYELTAELVQPEPQLCNGDGMSAQHTGFQVKYCGPDTDGRRTEIPHSALFAVRKDQALADGLALEGLGTGAANYLSGLYYSSLRDIRRTYQRAFKALLFCRRLGLSARRQPHGTSELGYLLAQGELFAGAGYYQSGGVFALHAANLDFDFLPVGDDYLPPTPATDDRPAPSPQRIQAMFDWWERLFDYSMARAQVRRRGGHQLWHLFDEAQQKQPPHPGYLLRHMGADARHWQLDLRYFQGQNTPVYEVTSTDLCDDIWTLRVWHADHWLRALQDRFAARDIEAARPDLWASDDPAAPLPGETQAGNANLVALVTDSFLENGAPARYNDLQCINDGLRERGRRALISYLCHNDHVEMPSGQFATTPDDLSDLLLLDVQAGLREKASRIEEAITAAQTFIRRSRLGLEPSWKVTRQFARLWDSRFDTYQTWQRARARELYRENWIEFEELDHARRIEAFQFLESQLRTSTLTLAAPGGLDWWPDDNDGLEHTPELLQRRVPSELHALSTQREGLTTIGYPEYAAQPTWLAALPQADTSGSSAHDPSGGNAAVTVAETAVAESQPALSDGGAAAPGNPASPAPDDPTRIVGAESSLPLPLWMQSAMKLGTRFVRVAAGGVPQASLEFVPHGEQSRGACCRECGHVHAAGVDEYYFWLINTQVYSEDVDASTTGDATLAGSYQFGFQNSYYDQYQQQSIEWDDEDQVPALLAKWQPTPAVRLAWCRVHNRQFGQPRRSTAYVLIDEQPDLTLLGRAGDSLHFAVTGAASPPAGYGASAEGNTSSDGSSNADMSPPGFRYDLPTDDAVAVPLALKPPPPTPPAPTNQYPGGLLAYPFFAYEEPGARLFPGSWFATSMAVAGALRGRCGYELALRWYRRAFDPLQQDCAWMHCPSTETNPAAPTTTATATTSTEQPTQEQIAARAYNIWQQHGSPQSEADQDWQEAQTELEHPSAATPAENATAKNGHQPTHPGACCDATQVTEQAARNRAVTMNYCRTLIDWGDALMRRGHSPEAFQQARVLYDAAARITGPRPRTILLPEPATAATVAAFVPAYAPLNPLLIDLYDLTADRVGLIHRSLDARRLRNGRPGRDMPYFGNRPAADLQGAQPSECGDEEDWCGRPSPYRFLSQIQKAIELAGKVRELGAALLSAYEKGDAEYLASIRAEQEREMQTLGIAIRQDQWRDADWQVQALQQTKDLNVVNLLYYLSLHNGGLINDEIQDLSLVTNALQTRTSASTVEVEGEVMSLIPDFFVGAMSTFSQIPIGTKLAGLFHAIAEVMRTQADIQGTTAGLDSTQAGWQRRSVEWLHQMQTLPIGIRQSELQILGLHRRRDQALAELNNQQRQIEHATEVLDFLRDKFSATDLYLWLQSQTAELYSQMYELARRAAREAERSFHFELRPAHRRRFVPEEPWDSLHAGLMAGERLDAAVHHMEKAYLDANRRELELSKHISLRLDFPASYLRLRTTGYCEINIPEWMFDLNWPGHYMRRIKSVSLTLPCVTSPTTGVQCRLTLLSSMTRTHPEVRPPAQHCCCDGRHRSDYEPCLGDPRVVHDYAARESIATSSGQNDSGLFELSFRDERYLPFEYLGAVSRWRIELPQENNYFDLNTLTDLVLNLNYTAREGGTALREAAAHEARGRLPGDGLRLFDVRQDFSDAWPALREPGHWDDTDDHRHRQRRLRLGFTPAMFPFIPGRRVHSIERLLFMFAAPDAEPGRHHLVRVRRDEEPDCGCVEVECIASDAWPGLFCGTVDLGEHPLGPLRDDRPTTCTFEIPNDVGEICNAFLIADYHAQPWPRCGPPPAPCPDDSQGAGVGSNSSGNGQPAATPTRG